MPGRISGLKKKITLDNLPGISRKMIDPNQDLITKNGQMETIPYENSEQTVDKATFSSAIYFRSKENGNSSYSYYCTYGGNAIPKAVNDVMPSKMLECTRVRRNVTFLGSPKKGEIYFIGFNGIFDPRGCDDEIIGTVENVNPYYDADFYSPTSATPCSPRQGGVLVLLNNRSTAGRRYVFLDDIKRCKMIMIPENNIIFNISTGIDISSVSDPSCIFVHEDVVADYKAATNWCLIADRIFPMSAYTNWID